MGVGAVPVARRRRRVGTPPLLRRHLTRRRTHGERLVATRIGTNELHDTDSQPGILREEAFAKPGLWAGRSTTEPGVTSGWHHHGGADTLVYVLSGTVVIDFGEGGRQAVQAGAGDFLVIPSGLVHRESTPGGEPSRSVVIRAGGDGPPTIEVDGPSS